MSSTAADRTEEHPLADPITTDEAPTTTVRDALAAVGMADRPDGEVVLASITGKGIRHYTLATVGGADPADAESLYVASGLFAPGVVSIKGGRTTDHVTRVVWLPFDADLIAMLDPDKVTADDLHAATQEEIDDILRDQIVEVDRAFTACGFPLHRLDYTGYGLCAYGYVHEGDQHRVADAQRTHKGMVAALNAAAGFRLFDAQVSDAGPRITRVPGSLNRKGATPRIVRTLRPWDGRTAYLDAAPTQPPAPRTPVDVPVDGDGLSTEAIDGIVDAIRPSWDEGQRHAMGVAVAGLLAKAGVPETQALDIVGRLAAGDRKAYDRYNALRRSYDRVRAGQAVAGYTQLQQLMPPDALAFVANILDRYQESTAAVPDLTPFETLSVPIPVQKSKRAPGAPQAIQIAPLPDVCMRGWLKRYVDLVEPTCEAADAFHLASGMALVGSTMGRAVAVRYISKSLYANQYLMIVGSAGSSRKDTAIRIALELPHHQRSGAGQSSYDPFATHTPPFTLATDVGSAEGLIGLLSATPNVLLYVTEYQRLIRNAKRQSTGTIFPVLTNAWDTPVTISNLTKGNPLEAKFPCLSVIAAVQPGILAQETGAEDIESGFATRWLYVLGAGKEARPEPPDIDPDAAHALYADLLRTRAAYTRGDQETRLAFDDDARERWIQWYREDRETEVANEDEEAMRSRLGVHVRKVALIYAASEGALSISLEHLEAAIAFVEWCWGHTRELMKTWGVTVWGDLEARIQRVLTQAKAGMPRYVLQAKCSSRRWGQREFGQVIEAMNKNGTIVVDAQGVIRWRG